MNLQLQGVKKKEQLEQVLTNLQLQDVKKKELDKERSSEVLIKTNLKPPDVTEPSISVAANEVSQEESHINKQDLQSLVNSKLLEAKMKQKVTPILYQETNSEQIQLSGLGSTNLEQKSIKAPLLEGPSPLVSGFSMTGTQAFAASGSGATQKFAASGSGASQIATHTFAVSGSGATQTFAVSTSSATQSITQPFAAFGSGAAQTLAAAEFGSTQTLTGSGSGATQTFVGFGSSAISFSGKTSADSAGPLNRKDLNTSVEMGKVSPVNDGLPGFPSTSSQSLSSRKFICPKDTDADSPLVPSSSIQGDTSENSGVNAKNIAVNLAGELVHLKGTVGTSTPHNLSDRLVQSWGQRPLTSPVNIESLPSIRGSQVSSQENAILAGSAHHKQHPSKDNYRTLRQSGMLNSEPNLSKQFGNVMNMSYDLFSFTCFLDII